MSSKKTRNKKKEVDVMLYVFSNNPTDESAVKLLQMFYRGCYGNSVGIMRALNKDTQEEELILVGVEVDGEGKAEMLPIAKIFSPSEAMKYAAPDGSGNYHISNE